MKRLRTLTIAAALIIGAIAWSQSPKTNQDAPDQPPILAAGLIMPRIAPDGESIVGSWQGSLWRIPRAGGSMVRLTDSGGFDLEPAWSADGRQIAYYSSPNFFGGRLMLVDANGKSQKLPKPVSGRDPLHFHPDGKRLLGNFSAPGRGPVLAWYHLATGQQQSVLDPPARAENPALSPDGQWIAYTTSMDVPGQQGGNNGPQADLWRVSSQGGQPERITRFPARIHGTSIAADGQSVIVSTEHGGVHNDLYEIPLADPVRGVRKLTFGQADEDAPSVSRDGRWLVYTDNHSGPTELVVLDRTSGESRTVPIRDFNFGAPTGQLQITLTDKSRPAPAVARITLRDEKGKYHAPPGSLYRTNGNEMHFYARGETELILPAGKCTLTATRGPEYRRTTRELQIVVGQKTRSEVELDRWIDPAADGWHDGENHIHANYGYGHWYNSPTTMALQCAGEDLSVCNFMVANSDGNGTFDREYFRGAPDPLSTDGIVLYWNEEFRSTIWGHMTLVNLQQLVEPIYTGFADTTNPHDVPTNSDIADRTHMQNGLVNYTHPAMNVDDLYLGAYSAKALPLDVALGKIDSMDVMGSRYEANLPLWYQLLNCGFRLPASAGTDCFLNRIPSRLPGSDRAFAKIDGQFSYSRWIEGLRAGRSFVTNGPILDLSVEGQPIGHVIELDSPGKLRVRATASSQFPLKQAELIVAGKVRDTGKIAAGDVHRAMYEGAIDIQRSGWIAWRVAGPPQGDQVRGNVFAHTSPIYVVVKGRPVAARAEAEFFLAWIDRLWNDVRRRNRIPPAYRNHVEEQIAAARAVYRRLAESGPR